MLTAGGLDGGVLPARADLESEVQAYEAADGVTPPPQQPVLFVGSSSIRIWPNLPGAFPGLPVLNRGFGGSQMSDLLAYFDRLVVRYQPSVVVVYEGDNDLAAGKSVSQVFADYSNFLARVEQQLPGTKVAFLAVKPSPSRTAWLAPMQELNGLVRGMAESRRQRFIDVHTPMLNGQGQPRAELFQADLLHMNAAGYDLWKGIVAPVLAAASAPVGGTFLFDFGAVATPVGHGPVPDDPINYWNNVGDIGTSPTGQLLSLVTTLNAPTPLGLVMVRRFNGVNESGTSASTLFPINGTRDSLFGNTEVFNNLTDIYPSFKITGLDTQSVVSFTFYASRGGATDNRETGYTVEGANSGFAALDAANNVDNTATVTAIQPTGAGEITISLAPTANNNNANHFTYLGVMKMEVVPPQTPIVFVLEPVSRRVVEFESATFTAAVAGSPPYTIQWMTNGVPVPGASQFSYTIPSATLDLDGLLVSVSVANLAFSATSSNAVLRVVNDLIPPTVESVGSGNGQTIDVKFSEAVEALSAEDEFNYVVNDGANQVQTAVLQADGRTVVLTLATPVAGEFTVRVFGVDDLSLNRMVETTVTGRVPGPESQIFLIDFGGGNTTVNGPSPDDPVNFWNNVTTAVGASDSGVLANLITANNVPTTVSLVMMRRFNGANENGTTAAGVLYPVDATRDSLFGNTEVFSGLANIFPQFKLTGLSPDLTYRFTFYASRMNVGDNRSTGYTVEGATSGFAALNAANNITNTVTVEKIRPTAAGEIVISLAPTAANNNANHFTYLGVVRIQPAVEPPAMAAPTVEGGKIQLNWTGGGHLESAPTPLGPWTAIEPAPVAPYSEDIVPGANRYYRVVRP